MNATRVANAAKLEKLALVNVRTERVVSYDQPSLSGELSELSLQTRSRGLVGKLANLASSNFA